MGKKILVYTALFGDYDQLLDPDTIDDECDYICITDNLGVTSTKWDMQYLKTEENSVEMNRMYKILPHRFFAHYDFSLYVDANIKLKSGPSALIKSYMKMSPLSFPKHFMRNCIYDEAFACLQHKKITKSEYDALTNELLRANNFPEKIGLAENNILIRDHNNSSLCSVMEEWWLLFKKYAPRDQLSLMYLLWKNNISYSFMDESSRNNNPYFSYTLHHHNKSGNWAKNKLLLMSAMRDKNLLNKFVAVLIDKL